LALPATGQLCVMTRTGDADAFRFDLPYGRKGEVWLNPRHRRRSRAQNGWCIASCNPQCGTVDRAESRRGAWRYWRANIAAHGAVPENSAALMDQRARATFGRKTVLWRMNISSFGTHLTISCRFDDDSAHLLG
jgi:hypothetical protein